MRAGRYDVIVVGARVAGASTAMLLARQGLRVLALDRASFPSDTISSHQLQVPGVALLQRWGLLDRLTAAGTPAARRVRFDAGDDLVLDGRFPAYDGADALYSPRRTLLDALLIDAAREAGAEVRENFRVTELLSSDGHVVGIRGQARGGPVVTETATLVIGADGKRSFVAGAVRARRYREHPVLSFATYSYWSGVPTSGGELYQRPRRAVAAFPTNDGLTMIYSAAPITEFASARADLERHYLQTLDLCGDLGDRARAGSRVERLRTTPDQPNLFRCSYGPGWALVGDAGVVMDSVSAQGMTNALQDADYLSTAVAEGLGGGRPLAAALREHQRRRDRATRPMYDFTVKLADLRAPTLGQRHVLAAVASDPSETDRFLGAFAGIVPADEYFSAATMLAILGSRGVRKLAAAKANQLFTSLRRPHPVVPADAMTRSGMGTGSPGPARSEPTTMTLRTPQTLIESRAGSPRGWASGDLASITGQSVTEGEESLSSGPSRQPTSEPGPRSTATPCSSLAQLS